MANIVSWDADAFDLGAPWVTTNGVEIDTSTKYEGTGSMKVTSIDDTQRNQGYWNDNGFVHDVNFGNSFFHRWYMKFDSAFEWRPPIHKAKTNRWGSSGGAQGSPLTGYIQIDGVLPGEHNEGFTSDQGVGSGGEGPTIGYDFNPATNAAIQGWQEYIVEYKIHSAVNATDGHMKFYVNGVVTGTSLTGVRWWTDRPTANTYFEQWGVFCMSNFFPQDANGVIWIDLCSLDTTYNSVWVEGGGEPGASSAMLI